jgi:hypothetical protein
MSAKIQEPDAFDSELEWFLISGDSAMGERGTLGSVVSRLELMGATGGVPSTDLYTDQQVGLGHTVIGLVERHRWLTGAWNKLDHRSRQILTACYTAPRAAYRGDESTHRASSESRLGRFAGLAFALTANPAKLFEACMEPSKGKHGQTISAALKAATKAAIDAHTAWRAAKGEARKPRKRSERAVTPKVHNPHDPQAEVE